MQLTFGKCLDDVKDCREIKHFEDVSNIVEGITPSRTTESERVWNTATGVQRGMSDAGIIRGARKEG